MALSGDLLTEIIEFFGGKEYDYNYELYVTIGVIAFSLIVVIIFFVFLDENLNLKPQFRLIHKKQQWTSLSWMWVPENGTDNSRDNKGNFIQILNGQRQQYILYMNISRLLEELMITSFDALIIL